MVPMATTAAPLMPTMAAKTAQMPRVPIARPPRRPPHQRCIMRYRSLATPVRSRIIAMKTNRGIATRVKLSMVPQICEDTM